MILVSITSSLQRNSEEVLDKDLCSQLTPSIGLLKPLLMDHKLEIIWI